MLIAQKTASGTEDEVLGLRNSETTAFATALRVLQDALSQWMRARIEQGTGGVRVASVAFLGE
jgi:hypothetical protein